LYPITSLLTMFHLYTAAPVIDPPSSSTVTVTIGDSITLSCTSRGSLPDTFTWMKDGIEVNPQPNVVSLAHDTADANFIQLIMSLQVIVDHTHVL